MPRFLQPLPHRSGTVRDRTGDYRLAGLAAGLLCIAAARLPLPAAVASGP